jgi:CRISPR/Cas system-associated exonuclease Cas4 (RecB family)
MFQSIVKVNQSRFNSITSCNFLEDYNEFVSQQILNEELRQPSMTFAPSAVRCKRISWFRLRGVAPEQEVNVDKTLNHIAQVGTACHRIIQQNLMALLGDDWLDVETYLNSQHLPYEYTCTKNETETLVVIQDPPIKFAPDGIIRYQGKTYLLEIKTSEFSSFEKLDAPKPHHIDQIKCYGTILNLHDAIVIYQDRQYGAVKCYEFHITDADMKSTWNMFKEVQECVRTNIAPPKLPKGDKWCNRAHCRYYNKCQEW